MSAPPIRPAPVPPELLDQPLDFLLAEHQRQKEMCGLLEAVASGQEAGDEATAILLDFLERELPLHRADEEDDLYGLMRRRCQPEDGIEALLDRLSMPSGLEAALAATLSRRQAGAPIGRLAMQVTLFVTPLRLHFAYSNAILIPLARRRLRRSDLAGLARRMRERRGLPPEPAG